MIWTRQLPPRNGSYPLLDASVTTIELRPFLPVGPDWFAAQCKELPRSSLEVEGMKDRRLRVGVE